MKSKNFTLNLTILIFLILNIAPIASQNLNPVHKDIYIEKTYYESGNIYTTVKNLSSKDITIKVNCFSKASETTNEIESFSKTFELNIGVSTIKLTDHNISEGLIQITNLRDDVIDQKNFKDGQWTIENETDLFTYKVLPEERNVAQLENSLERSFVVVPKLYNQVLVSRTFGENQAKDLSQFTHLKFKSEELISLKMELIIKQEAFTIQIDNLEDGWQLISLKETLNQFAEKPDLTEVTQLKFTLTGDRLAMPIKLENFEFIHKYELKDVALRSKITTGHVFPNPSHGQINIRVPFAGEYQFEVYSDQGLAFKKTMEIDQDFKINLAHLPAGRYTYKLFNYHIDITDQLILL